LAEKEFVMERETRIEVATNSLEGATSTRALAGGIDDMQRNFKPMVQAVERWRTDQITGVTARLVIHRAFVEAELEAPRHLDLRVS
jgi:hypothetical protein